MDRSQCKNKFESRILFHHREVSFWRQKSEKYYRYSWKDTQQSRTAQQTIRSTMSYIKDFLTKWPIKIASKIEIASNIRIFPTQILIYWCLGLKKKQTAIQNLNFHFYGFGVNFFMMVITLTGADGEGGMGGQTGFARCDFRADFRVNFQRYRLWYLTTVGCSENRPKAGIRWLQIFITPGNFTDQIYFTTRPTSRPPCMYARAHASI